MLRRLITTTTTLAAPAVRRIAPVSGSVAGAGLLSAAAWTGLGPAWGLAAAGLGCLALEWRVNE